MAGFVSISPEKRPPVARERYHILYVDAYDSFANNIVDMIECHLPAVITKIQIDSNIRGADLSQLLKQFDAVVLGPGPGNPSNAADVGIMKDFWSLNSEDLLPVLGICLGFQSLCLSQGAQVVRLQVPRHGRIVSITHSQDDIFGNLPCTFPVTLYHSLVVKLDHQVEISAEALSLGSGFSSSKTCPKIKPLSWCLDDSVGLQATLLAARHKNKPFWGVQFHPESCTSSIHCQFLLKNWWAMALDWSRNRGRVVSRLSPNLPLSIGLKNASYGTSELEHAMESLAGSSKSEFSFRTMEKRNLSTELVCELVGTPYGDNVVFDSNGRYSIISVKSPSSFTLSFSRRNSQVCLSSSGTSSPHCFQFRASIWTSLSNFLMKKRLPNGNPDSPFWGGFLGYFSYEMGLEKFKIPLVEKSDNSEEFPDANLLWTERSIVIDHQENQLHVQSIRSLDGDCGGWIDEIVQNLKNVPIQWSEDDVLAYLATASADMSVSCQQQKDYIGRLQHSDSGLFQAMIRRSCNLGSLEEDSYKEKIRDCQEYISAGDSYELCLTGEAKILIPATDPNFSSIAEAWLLYKELYRYNPARFSAYALLGSTKVVSSSPECFMQWDRSGTIEMKPMKGTVPKMLHTTLEDAREILGSTKEMAENLMIADLIRHDLHGIAGSGRVHVKQLMEVEEHARVYQLVTHVVADLPTVQESESQNGDADSSVTSSQAYGLIALSECLPPGSMTGAPKRRSCEILHKLEGRNRGVYSGVMGFLDVGGGGCFSVMIRTAACQGSAAGGDELWRIGAGGAITALSTEQGEWGEVQTKLETVTSVFNTASSCSEVPKKAKLNRSARDEESFGPQSSNL